MNIKSTLKIASFFVYCMLINFLGKLFAESFQLPLWLDSIGTVTAGFVFGPVCGGIVGAAVNLMYGAIANESYYYAITNVLVGVFSGYMAQKKMFRDLFHAFSVSMILAVVSTIVSTPINYFFFDGLPGNLWGDGVVHYFQEIGVLDSLAFLAGEFSLDLLDKVVSVLCVFLTLILREKRAAEKKTKVVPLFYLTLLGVLWGSATLPVNAQSYTSADKIFSMYTQRIYADEDGILGGTVNDIEQTMEGMLWVGTYGGLYTYDGNKFTLMSEYDSVKNVNCLYTDEEGRLLIGTNDSGLSICANYEIVNVLDEFGGLSSNSVRSIIKSTDGYYYIGTSEALDIVYLADGVNISRSYEEMSYVRNLAADKNGYVCAIDVLGRLGLFRGAQLLSIFECDSVGETFNCAYFDEENTLYLATSGDVIEKYEIDGDTIRNVGRYRTEGIRRINALCKNEDGILLISADNGIGYMTSNGKYYSLKTPGFDSSIDNIMIDYQGNYWFSSSRLGLLEMRETVFEELYAKAGMNEKVVNSVTLWDGELLFGTDAGLDVLSVIQMRAKENDLTQLLGDARVRCLMVDHQDDLWVATSGEGVYCIHPDHSYVQFSTDNGLVSNKARVVNLLSDDRIAVATDNGVSIIEDGKVVRNFVSADGMTIERTLCLQEYEGAIYCGTDGGGVVVLRDKEVEKVYRRRDGLGSDIILRIVPTTSGDALFVITSNGISVIDKEGGIRQISDFPYYNNFDIIPAKNGKLWITSSAGIYIVDEESLLGAGPIEYELLDAKKGLTLGLVANSWNYCDDNLLILCGDKGAISIDMDKYDKLQASYRIMLSGIRLDGVGYGVDSEDVNYIDRDVVRVEFEPKVINYSVNDPYVSVWLEGFDEEPRILLQSELDTLAYTNLPSGQYTFHLAILDSKKQQEIERVSYSFLKEQEIYDNWWFVLYMLSILAIVLVYMVWLLVGTQINKSLQIERAELENLRLKQTADAALAAGEAKDRFLALMSHDIRTPINAILGMNEMILRESKDKTIFGYAKDIQGAGDTLITLVNSILDFSKIENGKLEIIPVIYETRKMLVTLVKGVRTLSDRKGLEFRVNIDANIPEKLYGDDVRISQVLSNLLSNAVKYTESGYVELTIKMLDMTGNVVRIFCEVKDTGIGIKPEDKERLFEAFQRLEEERNRNIEGTGLGMSIITNLLDMMGSKLEMESEYGKGSTFSFVLEQRVESQEVIGDFALSATEMGDQQQVVHVCIPDARILVVDDSDMNLKVAAGFLRANGVVPELATSGKEAIRLAGVQIFDLIFMDHMMPDMDGVETLKELRRQQLLSDKTKVVVLTANAINGAKEFYLNEGFDDYLTKPIEPEKLELMLIKHLHSLIREREVFEEEQIQVEEVAVTADKREEVLKSYCPDIDPKVGLQYTSDSWEFYYEVLHMLVEEYLDGKKLDQIMMYYEQQDYDNYRTLVHTVKSSVLSLGAVEVSAEAKQQELAAKEGRIDDVVKHYAAFIEHFSKLLNDIQVFLEQEGV